MAENAAANQDIDDEEEIVKESKRHRIIRILLWAIFHALFLSYFIWATVSYATYDRYSDKCKRETTIGEDDNQTASNQTYANQTNTNQTNANQTEIPTAAPLPILCDINWCHGYGFLLLIFIFFYFFYVYYVFVKPAIGQIVYEKAIQPTNEKWMAFSRKKIVTIIMLLICLLFVTAIVIYETYNELRRLIGLCGPALFILTGYTFSKHRKSIKWRIVIHALFLQFILCLICMRLAFGRDIFKCAGEKATIFLGYSEHGARFTYGDRITDDFVFAFRILAVIFFFSVIVSILYYLGVMQPFVRVAGWLLQTMIGTTVCESVNAACNIVLGMSESPLVIKPYISDLTASELHAIMVSGFATVAGTVLGAYVAFGASPSYLITASVMAAPSSLGFAKLYYPETEESLTSAENIKLGQSENTSVLDAAIAGATAAIWIVLGIVASIIAFIAIVAFLNAVVEWLFELIGFNGISFMVILTYIFIPLVFIMGVPWHDCYTVGKVVAEKTIINEFVGYRSLGVAMKNEEIEPRSAAIATFALCGFSNPGSLAIMIAALSTLSPDKRPLITNIAIRALFAGSVVSFTSASWAGLLLTPEDTKTIALKAYH